MNNYHFLAETIFNKLTENSEFDYAGYIEYATHCKVINEEIKKYTPPESIYILEALKPIYDFSFLNPFHTQLNSQISHNLIIDFINSKIKIEEELLKQINSPAVSSKEKHIEQEEIKITEKQTSCSIEKNSVLNKSISKQLLQNFAIWIHYNERKIKISEIKPFVLNFLKNTNKGGEFCSCNHRSRAVNVIWKEWRCTTCLKPKK